MTIKLVEAGAKGLKTNAKGIFEATLITAGQGSSGYYSEDLLKEYGPKVFKAKMPSFMNHLKEGQDPWERDINALAAVLTEDAWYDPTEKALKAKIKVRKEHIDFVEDFKDSIGMSIFAVGTAEEGDSPETGEPTNIVTSFEEDVYNSVDFVVAPGRGGKVGAMVESARRNHEASSNERSRELNQLARQKFGGDFTWVEDFDDDKHVAWVSTDDGTYQVSYTVGENDIANGFGDDKVKVVAKTTYVATESGNINSEDFRATGSENPEGKELSMDKDIEAKFDVLSASLNGLIEALKPVVETPDPTEVDYSVVAESVMDAGLSKSASRRVFEAVKAGAEPEKAIESEKAIRDEYLAEAKAEAEKGGDAGGRLFESDGGKNVTVNDLDFLKVK